MADVENISQVTAAPTPVAAVAISSAASVAEAAGSPQDTNGTSSTQEKSSNSHLHDSEYDTASDLEGGEDYDDDDDDDLDDSLTDEDDDEEDETETDDDEDDDDEGIDGSRTSQDKADAEAQKKVDEDRSNPQYIPKRGTFYEHDDRTAEGEGEGVVIVGADEGEGHIVTNGASTGAPIGTKSSVTPPISAASKTMKKWQPASAVDRWSHDRFDPSEQAPKSKNELVTAYGYDIRTEDAPPKARRRRRYGRGPSKYIRNWEDESAYIKSNLKERKPPKASDFPALNDKARKQRRSPARRTREEKENHMERRQRGEGRPERTDRQAFEKTNYPEEQSERRPRGDGQQKPLKTKSNYNRQGGQATAGRQAAMEFKQKNRQPNQNQQGFTQNTNSSNLSSRLDAHRQQGPSTQAGPHNQKGNSGPVNANQGKSPQQNYTQQQNNSDNYSGRKKGDRGSPGPSQVQGHPNTMQQNNQQPQQSSAPNNHNVNRHNNAPAQHKPQMPSTNLTQRLQQVQNRNDPSHVGSVQMHSLATQNQQQQQQILQQQQTGNMMMGGPQANQQTLGQPQEQRGPPKRYSSLRRSQHEAQHMTDHQQQQMQQMHMQQQQQNPAPPQAMLIPGEQAMLQANLMQMYHQENLQAQMQALQVSQQPNVPKQPGYAPSGAPNQPSGPYAGTAPPPAAYYVPGPDAYTAASAAQATQVAAAATYAAQPPAPGFIAQPPNPAGLAYANNAPNPQQAATATPAFPAAANVGVGVPQTTPPQPTPGNYQNYNTVGGTTYFVPPHTQPSARPVSLPPRRPTNAIPILPPSDKNNGQAAGGQQQQQKPLDKKDESKGQSGPAPVIGSAENIDHIIDNMFVQRPAFQPPSPAVPPTTAAKTANSEPTPTTTTSSENANASNATATTASAPTVPQESSAQAPAENPPTESSAGATASTESSNNNPVSTQE